MKKKLILSVAVVLLVVMVATICVACTPSVDSVAKKFEKKDYEVIKTDNSVTAVKKGDGLLDGYRIVIVWCDSDESADKLYETNKKLYGEKGVARKGNVVAGGDEDSIKIFKF